MVFWTLVWIFLMSVLTVDNSWWLFVHYVFLSLPIFSIRLVFCFFIDLEEFFVYSKYQSELGKYHIFSHSLNISVGFFTFLWTYDGTAITFQRQSALSNERMNFPSFEVHEQKFATTLWVHSEDFHLMYRMNFFPSHFSPLLSFLFILEVSKEKSPFAINLWYYIHKILLVCLLT